MKWSLRIGKVAGIKLYLHFTFIILIAWLVGSHYLAGHTFAAGAAGLAYVLLLFAIIVLHELGHSLAAKRYGIETRDITLLPIGGVARLERMPEDPGQELVVALAGPVVNILLAGIFFGLALLVSGVSSVYNVTLTGGEWMARLFWINVWLAGFNLLPAFPMDGGRALRAILAMRMNRAKATDIAARIGQSMAVLFGIAGLFLQPFLLFIALFVWIGAESEASEVRLKADLEGVAVRDVMSRDFQTIEAEDTLLTAAHKLAPGFQPVLPVLEDGRFIGFIGAEQVASALSMVGPNAPLEHYVDRTVVSATPDEPLQNVLPRWDNAGTSVVAVFMGNVLVGILTTAKIGQQLLLNGALPKTPNTHLTLRSYPR